MKNLIIACCILALFAASNIAAAEMEAEVRVQVASTHPPTPEFQEFAGEFLRTFGDIFWEKLEPSSLNMASKNPPKLFFLIERQDHVSWQIGLCEPKEVGEPPIGFSSAELSFNPLWVVEGKSLKDKGQRESLAREAAQFLFEMLGRKKI